MRCRRVWAFRDLQRAFARRLCDLAVIKDVHIYLHNTTKSRLMNWKGESDRIDRFGSNRRRFCPRHLHIFMPQINLLSMFSDFSSLGRCFPDFNQVNVPPWISLPSSHSSSTNSQQRTAEFSRVAIA